ncbi:MAG: VWA domain-containing protein [Acidobacteria bacterium]|nr:VWA domain-containing protein [Acidobacteriota bacterium]
MRHLLTLVILLCLTASAVAQQQQPQPDPQVKLTVRSNLVMVPVFVTGGDGNVVFGLNAEDFALTDNGAPQSITIEDDTDAQPLALAIVVETGGAGARHLDDYRALDSILDAIIGNVEHNVAVIGFDSTPHLIQPFTPITDKASRQIANLTEGDGGAAILDAVAFAVDQLRKQPPTYRRAILLLSETIDQGSETTLDDAVHLMSDTNTAIYTFAFSSTSSAVRHEASKFDSKNPGPAHGCFSKKGADVEYEGHYSKQVLDCISQLAPPLRLATMAFIAARGSLKVKTAESIAELAGGEYFPFKNEKDLKTALIALSNNIPNYYVLSFRPTTPTPGIHALQVTSVRRPYSIKSRREYWIDDDQRDPATLTSTPTPN